MVITLSNRFATGAAVAAIAAGAAGVPAAVAVPAGGGVVAQVAAGTAASSVGYWTPSRMAAALRVADGGPSASAGRGRVRRLARQVAAVRPDGGTTGKGLRWTGQGAVAAAVGKVFFTLGEEDYVCSGALVGGERTDVVLTAAHCVTGGPGPGGAQQWATNWMFVPGFAAGLLPYGEYAARRFFVSPDWTGPAGGREQYDAAFVQVGPPSVDGVAAAAQLPPGLPVRFADRQEAAPLGQAYVFGYPALGPYNGLDLSYCAGPAAGSGGSVRTPCDMTAGDSGGPWLAGLGAGTNGGPVVAVSTYKVSGDPRVLYGAVLGPQARALYERAVGSAG
jgi:V8-like Glu-specific endopeptidase